MLNLVDFGYYSIANQLNTATRTSSGAVCQAIFPRLSVLHLKNDVDKLTSFFHKASQFISLIVLPTSIVIAFFSREILFVWLQNWEIATSVALIASVLIVGSAFNSAMGIPYDMSVASGWTTFGLYQNIVSSLIIIPLMLWLIYVYGALGAAIAWLILNFGYLVIAAPIIISRCLPKGELSVWYIDDVGKPLLACLFFVVLARYFFPENYPLELKIGFIACIWFLTQLVCLATLKHMRDIFFTYILNVKSFHDKKTNNDS
jgi:O-antigen/teichoic acid export membrane protein